MQRAGSSSDGRRRSAVEICAVSASWVRRRWPSQSQSCGLLAGWAAAVRNPPRAWRPASDTRQPVAAVALVKRSPVHWRPVLQTGLLSPNTRSIASRYIRLSFHCTKRGRGRGARHSQPVVDLQGHFGLPDPLHQQLTLYPRWELVGGFLKLGSLLKQALLEGCCVLDPATLLTH